jgi:hypothetical protein
MRIADAKPRVSALENPEKILNERALVGRLNSNLIKLVNPKRNRSAERALEGKGVAIQPVVRAQVGRHHHQWLEEQLAESRI